MPEISRAAWVTAATRTLREAAVDSPRLSAVLILRHVLALSQFDWLAHPETSVPEHALARLEALLQRRRSGEPAAYLLGEREFYGRAFAVNRATLIPRPETEHLVEAALTALPATPLRFADLGTGSGCIAVTLCAERPHWKGLAADISGQALEAARRNARRYGVEQRLCCVQADFTQPLLCPGTLDLVISNPPYVSASEYAELSPEVRDFEPTAALLPQENADGLEHLKIVPHVAAAALRPGGLLLMEHGWTQGEAVRLLLFSNIWTNIVICKDLSNHDRFVIARRAPYSE